MISLGKRRFLVFPYDTLPEDVIFNRDIVRIPKISDDARIFFTEETVKVVGGFDRIYYRPIPPLFIIEIELEQRV